MATNDFLPFGTGAGANVLPQTDWAALADRSNGFQSGKAKSLHVNKAIRQANAIASMIGQFTADYGGNALDNGDIPTLEANFKAALAAWIASGTSPVDLSAYVLRAGDTMTGAFNAIEGFRTGARVLTTPTTLDASDLGKVIEIAATSSITTTIPTPVSVGGAELNIWNNSSYPQTLSTPAGAFLGPNVSSATTITMLPGDVFILASDGSNWFRATVARQSSPVLTMFTSSTTWNRAPGSRWLFGIAHGPGGAGGGDPAGGALAAGAGGGGGGWAMGLYDISSLSTAVVVVAAGGTGVVSNKGGDGAGNTSFGSLLVAGPGKGGRRGTSSFPVPGGEPGVGITGQILGRGSPGEMPTTTGYDTAGNGGGGLLGGGGIGQSDDVGLAPSAGILGGGGGGGDSGGSGSPACAGANGGDGFVLTLEF